MPRLRRNLPKLNALQRLADGTNEERFKALYLAFQAVNVLDDDIGTLNDQLAGVERDTQDGLLPLRKPSSRRKRIWTLNTKIRQASTHRAGYDAFIQRQLVRLRDVVPRSATPDFTGSQMPTLPNPP